MTMGGMGSTPTSDEHAKFKALQHTQNVTCTHEYY